MRAVRAAAILEDHGYKVVGTCALDEWKAKGWDLVYPQADAKVKESDGKK